MGPSASRELNAEQHLMRGVDLLRKSRCPIFWVIGCPGAGKSSICMRLARHYGFTHIDVNVLLYRTITHGDWVPEKGGDDSTAKDVTETEGFVPRRLLLAVILKEMVTAVHTSRGFLLDGFPRHADQGQEFLDRIAPVAYFFYFKLPAKTIRHRLRGRSNAIVPMADHDMVEINAERLRSFYRFVGPMLKIFSDNLLVLNAARSFDNIMGDMFDTLDEYLGKKGISFPKRFEKDEDSD